MQVLGACRRGFDGSVPLRRKDASQMPTALSHAGIENGRFALFVVWTYVRAEATPLHKYICFPAVQTIYLLVCSSGYLGLCDRQNRAAPRPLQGDHDVWLDRSALQMFCPSTVVSPPLLVVWTA